MLPCESHTVKGLNSIPFLTEVDTFSASPPHPPVDLKKESKENQWLGVTVKSQGPGGKIVVSGDGWMGGWSMLTPLGLN